MSSRGPGRYSGQKKRGPVLKSRRKDYDQNHRLYENNTKTKYHRPGSQQDDRHSS